MSYWLDQIPARTVRNVHQALPCEVVDVVIVGSGISGASVAYHLTKNDPSISCVLLDKGELCSGATGCNGGFICPGTSERFSASVERYGLEVTQELFDYTVQCAEGVKDFVDQHNVDCEMRFNGSVLLAQSNEELLEVRTSFEQLSSYGVPVEWWDAAECEKRTKCSSYLGGLYKPKAGMLWAAKLVHSLIDKAEAAGVKVYPYTTVDRVGNTLSDRDNSVIQVMTNRGDLRTRKLVHCTNAWTRELLPRLSDIVIPVRNQVKTPPFCVSI